MGISAHPIQIIWSRSNTNKCSVKLVEICIANQYLFLFFVSSFIVNCNDLKIHDGPQNKHFYSKTFFLSTKENPHFTQLTNLPIKTICRTSILDLKRYFPTCIQTMFMDTAHKEREIRVGKIVL
jgi:hypothetical protein